MIINAKTRVKFRGVTCTSSFDYYVTATGAVKCRVTYTPVCKDLRHLRGHATIQLLNLALIDSVQSALMFLGLSLDEAPAAELFAVLASSALKATDDATCIAEWLNA